MEPTYRHISTGRVEAVTKALGEARKIHTELETLGGVPKPVLERCEFLRALLAYAGGGEWSEETEWREKYSVSPPSKTSK